MGGPAEPGVLGAAGTGYVDIPDSRAAGARAARAAMDASTSDRAALAFCFHHGRHDGQEVFAGVRSQIGGDVPIVGGTAMGIITNHELGYEGHQVGVAVVGADLLPEPAIVTAAGLGEVSEEEVGTRLGAALAERLGGPRDVLLLYSSIRRGLADGEGFALHFGTPLVAGFLSAAGPVGTVAGAGLIDSLQPSYSHVFTPDGPDRAAAVAIAFDGDVRLDTVVLHGCRPASAYHTITRTDGPVVLEIDGKPALQVIDELVAGALPRADYPFRLVLGVNHGERFGDFDEEAYQTRVCLAVDEEHDGLVMFEPDLEPGAEFQVMRVSSDLSYVEDRVAGLLARLDGRRPLLAIYADCAGRSVMGSAQEEEEGHAVREAVGDIPLLGFYTGVEIAPVAGRVRPLDVTGVLCVLSA